MNAIQIGSARPKLEKSKKFVLTRSAYKITKNFTMLTQYPTMHLFGQYAEQSALAYLKKKGFAILEQNFRYKRFEIDIIARKAQLIVFVEVKARKNSLFGYRQLQ